MHYNYSNIEELVHALYESIDIYHPHQLDPEEIAARLGLSVMYAPLMSFYADGVIIIDERLPETRQWQDFTHELAHALLHVGSRFQLPPTLVAFQEQQAETFSRHACVPSRMLERLELPDYESAAIGLICETFCVEPELARARLRQFMRNRYPAEGGLRYI